MQTLCLLPCCLHIYSCMSELLIFRKVVEPRNSQKTHKIQQNSVDILSNTCLYNIFETYLSYWGCLLAVNLQICLETLSLKCANNVPKLPGVDYVAKNWALAMMLKALPLVHFWSILLLKEQMMTSVRKTFNTLVSSAQNRSICSEICPENNHKTGRFLTKLLFGEISLENSRKIGQFFHKFVPETPVKFDIFSTTNQKPCYVQLSLAQK